MQAFDHRSDVLTTAFKRQAGRRIFARNANSVLPAKDLHLRLVWENREIGDSFGWLEVNSDTLLIDEILRTNIDRTKRRSTTKYQYTYHYKEKCGWNDFYL